MARKMNSTAARLKPGESRAVRRKRSASRKNSGTWIIGGLAFLFVALVVFLFYISQPASPASAMGRQVAVASSDHVPDGTDPGPYSTDPPVGGKHYATDLTAGFYDEERAAAIPFHPEGYIVHSMEHGYVVYYYNCNADPEISCDDIKAGIQTVMDGFNNVEVIAFPWPSQETPIVMASWGRIMPLETVDLDSMRQFYRGNLNKSPEAEAD
jgi:hypothetical protein